MFFAINVAHICSMIRLEMDYSQHSYHSCIDAVLLNGILPEEKLTQAVVEYNERKESFESDSDDSDQGNKSVLNKRKVYKYCANFF